MAVGGSSPTDAAQRMLYPGHRSGVRRAGPVVIL